ncbi:hypothetical protein COOONC_12124 [Cooperia oncophora]
MGICGLGIFEALKIPSSIATFSGVHMDAISKNIGEPASLERFPGFRNDFGNTTVFIRGFFVHYVVCIFGAMQVEI